MDINLTLEILKEIDPSPFFVLSLIPYIIFLIYAKKLNFIPKISYIGFSLTLLFVAMTIIFAIIAQIAFNDELTNIDPLHGAAEAFLTLSDALVVYGFFKFLQEKKEIKNS
tara:strand:+ start:966 stop:1298 length:333 start_codon:yes stop_codon:yes gene_type:complete